MATTGSTDVRKWAREQGLVTAARGRLPRSVLEAYAAAHPAEKPPGAAEERAAGAGSAKRRTTRSAPARTKPRLDAAGAAPDDRLLERVRALESDLATVVARLDALERRMTRSLLGLKVTL